MILGIIQARMGSARLPGKVLKPLGGRTVLSNVIDRVKRSNVDGVLVATSTNVEDIPIITEAVNNGVLYYAGSECDVLERYYKAASLYRADKIVRITADCPYIMPDLINKLIENINHSDYASNVIKRTYPKGLDIEVFTYEELKRTYECAATPYEREHVTPFMIEHRMGAYSLEDNEDWSYKRLTLDYTWDYEDLVAFYPRIGKIYNYQELKSILPDLSGHEEVCINNELGRV